MVLQIESRYFTEISVFFKKRKLTTITLSYKLYEKKSIFRFKYRETFCGITLLSFYMKRLRDLLSSGFVLIIMNNRDFL